MEQTLRKQICEALDAAGEVECRIVVTRTTHRVHYATGYSGYQIHRSFSTPLALEEKNVPGRFYLGVGCSGNRMKDLRRYEVALRAAGFSTVLCGTATHKSVRRVWVTVPVETVVSDAC
jgi:hypothetical protein